MRIILIASMILSGFFTGSTVAQTVSVEIPFHFTNESLCQFSNVQGGTLVYVPEEGSTPHYFRLTTENTGTRAQVDIQCNTAARLSVSPLVGTNLRARELMSSVQDNVVTVWDQGSWVVDSLTFDPALLPAGDTSDTYNIEAFLSLPNSVEPLGTGGYEFEATLTAIPQ